MSNARIVLLSAVVLVFTLPGSSKSSHALSGLITDVGSPAAFTVDTTLVHCAESTQNTLLDGPKQTKVSGCPPRYLGQAVTVYGQRDPKSGAVAATEIASVPPFESHVEGNAVVDAVALPDAAGGVTVSADGYRITIPASMHPVFSRSTDQPDNDRAELVAALRRRAASGRRGDSKHSCLLSQRSERAGGKANVKKSSIQTQ